MSDGGGPRDLFPRGARERPGGEPGKRKPREDGRGGEARRAKPAAASSPQVKSSSGEARATRQRAPAERPREAKPRVAEAAPSRSPREGEAPRRARESVTSAEAPRARRPREAADEPTARQRSGTPKPATQKPATKKPATKTSTAKASASPKKAPPRTSERRSRGDTRKGGGGGGRRPRRRFSLWRFALRMGVTLTLLGIVAVGAIIAYFAATLPPRAEWAVPKRPPNVAILSESGELIANRGDTGGRAVTLDELPAYVPQAVMAIEDRRFYSHPGVDPIGLARALVTNLTSGRLSQGGSTLTQQLAKNLFLDPSRTLERKIQEMVFAVWLEMKYSKDEILQMYLNRVYLGAGATGIDGAAQRYFDKPAEELTLSEAALIAGLLKAPSYYAPTNNLERSNARAATVLAAMHDAGFITAEEEEYARAHPAKLAKPKVATSGGYVADWVNEVLPGFVGDVTQDIVVETTINLELQDLAQSALQDMLAKEGSAKGVEQGAVVVLDGAGAVKALVGGKNYGDSQYNRAVSALRQPGSAFKPFVYLAALEHGLTPETMRIDQPTRIGNWTPENYSKKYQGPVTLKHALSHSLNTIAAQLTAEVGPKTVANVARRLGIRSPMDANASIALGTSEVSLLELTTAYVPFSNGGIGVVPHVVRRIKTADGQLLYEKRGGGLGEVVSLKDVGAMNRMMSAVVASGTGRRAQLDGWPAAGKTGTSQNWRDAWFVGYTAYFTAGVWLGNDDNSPTKKATGGSLPAELWKTLMTKVLEGMVPADLPGLDVMPEPVAVEDAPVDDPWNAPADGRSYGNAPVAAARDGRDWVRPAQNDNDRVGGFLRRLFGG